MKRFRNATWAGVLAIAILAVIVPGASQAGPYVAGGTAVYRENGQTVADDGAALCLPGGMGVGGACLPFGGRGGAVGVLDAVSGTNVAFQVCIDNNGDSKCTDNRKPTGEACVDQVFFSHSDDARFFNPLGPLPNSRTPGCPTTGWNGYVVFICEGVHVAQNGSAGGGQPHTHAATTGTISNAPAGSGYGNFCGSSERVTVEKDYQVV